MEWIIIALSIPFFYILGVIYLVKSIFQRNKHPLDEASFLSKVISDLRGSLKEKPQQTVEQQIKTYEDRLLTLSKTKRVPIPIGALEIKDPADRPSIPTPPTNWLDNWYAENSINILLYVGAFLIVAAASIFVGFQWETISGFTKSFLLTLLALSFLVTGIWFYSLEKIRNAGATFIAVGAVLIPIVGTGWYNLFFKPLGVQPGPIWLVTSLIAISLYLFLAWHYKNKLYSYATSAASLSLVLSFVKLSDLDIKFYILGSIITSFILFICTLLVKARDDHSKDLFDIPMRLSSDIIMPIALGVGLVIAASENILFSFEAVASVFLGAIFYLISYKLSHTSWRLALAISLAPLGIALFGNWLHVSQYFLLYSLIAGAYLYVLSAYFLINKIDNEGQDIIYLIGILIAVFSFLSAIILPVEPLHQVIISLALSSIGAILLLVKKDIRFIYLCSIFLAISTNLLATKVMSLTDNPLSFIYCLLGVQVYAFSLLCKNTGTWIKHILIAAGLFFLLSLHSGFSQASLFSISLIIALTFVHTTFSIQKPQFIYIASAFFYLAAYAFPQMLQWQNTELTPLLFSVVTIIIYTLSTFPKNIFRNEFRFAPLIGAIITTVLSTVYSEKTALLNSYLTTMIFALDFYLWKTVDLDYFTLALGVLTFLWQIKFLGVTEIIIYTVPMSSYFYFVSYLRRKKNQLSDITSLEILGTFFLLAPVFYLSLGPEQIKYSAMLGALGVGVLGVGITFSKNFYKYCGIGALVLAILPQTYNYILALPRWLGIGFFGLGFLAIAIFLQLKKK